MIVIILNIICVTLGFVAVGYALTGYLGDQHKHREHLDSSDFYGFYSFIFGFAGAGANLVISMF